MYAVPNCLECNDYNVGVNVCSLPFAKQMYPRTKKTASRLRRIKYTLSLKE